MRRDLPRCIAMHYDAVMISGDSTEIVVIDDQLRDHSREPDVTTLSATSQNLSKLTTPLGSVPPSTSQHAGDTEA